MANKLGSVQTFRPRKEWGDDVVYIGMPGKAAMAFGIFGADVGPFGKPWELKEDKRGWAAAYVEYLAKRLLSDEKFRAQVKALDGKTLLCWCTAKAKRRQEEVACHGRLLAEFVTMLQDK